MTNRLSNGTGRWRAMPLCMAALGLLVVHLALCSAAVAAGEQPASDSYADLPELSGPFSELKDVPESLKAYSILRSAENELAILPTSLRLYPNGSGFRLEHNLLAAAGITSGPMARLEFFVQPTVDDFASVVLAISKAFPRTKIGRPGIARAITAEFITMGLFPGPHTESILTFGAKSSINDIVFVTFESNHFFMRVMAGGSDDADIIAIRVSYEIPVQGMTRRYNVGRSFSFSCHASPESFLDLTNSRSGCPDSESWKLASPTR